MEQKKNRNADVHRLRGIFFLAGLVVSLGLVVIAFEWKLYSKGSPVALGAVEDSVGFQERC